VLYVTHNVQEALMLASRIIVLGDAPAKIIFDETIDARLSQRKLDDPDLLQMERRITGLFF
jgi:ABC-type nitrate/sulfonate/bicarbonate transport system ATPase subunit